MAHIMPPQQWGLHRAGLIAGDSEHLPGLGRPSGVPSLQEEVGLSPGQNPGRRTW